MRENLDNWIEMWAKAQKEIFPVSEAPKSIIKEYKPEKTSFKDVDSEYWNRVYHHSNGQHDAPDPLQGILNEEEKVPNSKRTPYAPDMDDEIAPSTKFDGKSVAQVTDELGGEPNPIQQPSRGKDALPRKVTPNWSDKQIAKLHDMKVRIQQLEDKVAASPSFLTKDRAKAEKQIEALWKQVDELSSSLNPDYVKDYLS